MKSGAASLKLGVLALGLSVLATCNVVETTQLTQTEDAASNTCANDGVAYFMPDRLINVRVTTIDGVSPKSFDLQIDDDGTSVADRAQKFCMAFKNNVFSKDTIGAEVQNGLLAKVSSDVEDQSATAIGTFVEGAAEVSAENQANRVLEFSFPAVNKASGEKIVFGPFPVDPFDEAQMAALNKRLADFGHCIHLDAYKDPYVGNWAPAQCGVAAPPARQGFERKPIDLDAVPTEMPEPFGVVYRPLLSHKMVVRKRRDPNLKTPFRQVAAYTVQLPNAAPNFSLAVTRAAFTTRNTTLTFDEGVLVDVSITKAGSEAAGFASIPINIAQAIVSVPAQIINLQVGNLGGRRSLLAAQQSLLEASAALADAQERLAQAEEAKAEDGGGGNDSAQLKFSEQIKQLTASFCTNFSLRQGFGNLLTEAECENSLTTCREQNNITDKCVLSDLETRGVLPQ